MKETQSVCECVHIYLSRFDQIEFLVFELCLPNNVINICSLQSIRSCVSAICTVCFCTTWRRMNDLLLLLLCKQLEKKQVLHLFEVRIRQKIGTHTREWSGDKTQLVCPSIERYLSFEECAAICFHPCVCVSYFQPLYHRLNTTPDSTADFMYTLLSAFYRSRFVINSVKENRYCGRTV